MKRRFFILLLLALAILGGYWLGKRGGLLQTLPPTPIGSPLIFKNPISSQPLTEDVVSRETPKMISQGELASEEAGGSISERLVIKRGNLSLLVKETLKAVEETKKTAEELGGFVLSARTWYVDAQKERVQAEVTIKVPAEKFSEAIAKLKSLAMKVVSEQTTGQDVTEEYVDLESQLKNLETAEEQLREIMGRSGKVSEILEVQRELTRVRGQIEQTEGRMKYLQESAALATITASIATEEEELPVIEEEWRPLKIIKAALRDLVGFWQRIAGGLIWLAVFFSPFILLLLLFWLARKIKK